MNHFGNGKREPYRRIRPKTTPPKDTQWG